MRVSRTQPAPPAPGAAGSPAAVSPDPAGRGRVPESGTESGIEPGLDAGSAAGASRRVPVGVAGRIRARIEDNIASHGLIYPWWIPTLSLISMTACAVVSLGLRGDLWPPLELAVILALVTLPPVLQVLYGRHFSHLAQTVGVIAAAAWLLTHPVPGAGAFDPAPALLALLSAEVVARDGVRHGVLVALGSVALVVGAAAGPGVNGVPVHLVDIVLGFAVGYMLLWQMRALVAERAGREGERARATLAERERIAREIHDLVAHSLSVTLLQITGARHALRDLGEDGLGEDGPDARAATVGEIDDALADAERVGRRAMADIRHTVSAMADGPAATSALPTAADIAGLVDQMRRAGLAVAYDEAGDPSRLAEVTGLGVYRIAQESLANIAKHAPTASAQVQLSVTASSARLLVRNPLTLGAAISDRGSGLAGMRARAAQLGADLAAGPRGGEWVVDLRLQLRERDGKLSCPLARRIAW